MSMIGENGVALSERQKAWGLNGLADNQRLNALNAFWEIYGLVHVTQCEVFTETRATGHPECCEQKPR